MAAAQQTRSSLGPRSGHCILGNFGFGLGNKASVWGYAYGEGAGQRLLVGGRGDGRSDQRI
jgi:hypothetical protein